MQKNKTKQNKAKMNLNPYLIPYMVQRPKCKNQSYKLLEENRQLNLRDLGFGNGFLAMTPKGRAIKK